MSESSHGFWPALTTAHTLPAGVHVSLMKVASGRFSRSGAPTLTEVEARKGDVSRLANRGALLHTDLAVALDFLDPITRSAAGSARPTALLILDGRAQGTIDRGPHWRLARALLESMPVDSPHADSERQWYVATAAYMQSRSLRRTSVRTC